MCKNKMKITDKLWEGKCTEHRAHHAYPREREKQQIYKHSTTEGAHDASILLNQVVPQCNTTVSCLYILAADLIYFVSKLKV